VAHDAAVRQEGGDSLVDSKEGDDAGGGMSGPQRPNGLGARWVNFGKEIKKRKGKLAGWSRLTGRNQRWAAEHSFQIFSMLLDSKFKDSNTFKLNLNWAKLG
jgi:hypothetical protein